MANISADKKERKIIWRYRFGKTSSFGLNRLKYCKRALPSSNCVLEKMQTPYEVASKSVIPAIRGMISRGLIERNFTQLEIARALGITQPAVSKYFWDKRGRAIDFDNRPDVKKMADVITDGIAEGKLSRVQVANLIKEMCDYIMRSGYMCNLHFSIDPQIKDSNCKICMEETPPARV
jgi:predicted transcriptional regulator